MPRTILCAAMALVTTALPALAQDYGVRSRDYRYSGEWISPEDSQDRIRELGLFGRIVDLPTLRHTSCRRAAMADGYNFHEAKAVCARADFRQYR